MAALEARCYSRRKSPLVASRSVARRTGPASTRSSWWGQIVELARLNGRLLPLVKLHNPHRVGVNPVEAMERDDGEPVA